MIRNVKNQMFRKHSKEVMLTAETCFIFNMIRIGFSCYFFFYAYGTG